MTQPSTKRRLSREESRTVTLQAARALLIEGGPQAVTLKGVGARVGRTHANLPHHFGSAGGLRRALAAEMSAMICDGIARAVSARRTGKGSRRDVVNLVFDAFDAEGGRALASWMLVSGNRDALDPVVAAIHALVERLHANDGEAPRTTALTLVLMALGNALMGQPLARALGLPAGAARDQAERMVAEAMRPIDEQASWTSA